MTSNVQWNNQFEGNYPGNAENNNAWNRPLVNTPQTNPASWPQLGATGAEAEQAPAGQPQPQEEANWTSTAANNSTTNSETTSSAWGRVPPDNGPKPKAPTPAPSGWGVPSSGPAWGQQTTVDNGTAVWGKSVTTPQPQGSWGGQGQSSQGNEGSTPVSGWGTANSSQPTNGTESNSQPPAASTSAATSSSQPVSWAKAASAGLPTSSSGGNGSSPTEIDQEVADSSTPPVAPPSSTAEADPVQKLVNSHEGWGKKPIQQGTSWNISETAPQGPGFSRPPTQVSNGTEAWGRHGGGQMPQGPGWGDSTNNKPGGGWGTATSTSYQPTAPGQSWGAPSQQPTRPGFMSGNGPAPSNWGDQPQTPAMNNGRWNEMSRQGSGSGWGNAPPGPMQPVNPSWGGGSQPNEANSSSQWGANAQGPGSQASQWNSNMAQQAPPVDQSSWNRPAEPGVDNGTAAWGDPGTYTKVNMWDKRGKGNNNNEAAAGQMPPMNNQMKSTGWGAPNQPANRPPSPKGWGDMSPTRSNPVDKGTSGWGQKPISNEKWDKGGSGAGNWNNMKQSGGGWNQPSDPQWGAADNGPAWGQNDGAMKGNVDFGPRGIMPSPLNMSQQQMMLRNQTPPNAPPQPQLQNQFQQIRHAVMNGIVPPQVLNPQLMTPQHVQNVMQLIAKTTEVQKVRAKLTTLMNQNKALPMPNIIRQQQIEQCMRAMRQNEQQLEMLRGIIIQNMLQKAQPMSGNKMNNPMNVGGGMDLGRMRSGSASQPMVSPLNNMNPMMQALPSPGLSSVTSPSGREESRFASNWKQPNNYGSMGDNLLHPNPSGMGLGMGPGGDSAFNGAGFRPQFDDPNMMEGRPGPDGVGLMARDPMSNQAVAEASAALADIGPPEFTPGVPWKGFRHIDPEADPNITPGSVAIAKTMSINTVRDVDQVLNRDRTAPQGDSSVALVNSPANNHPTVPNNNTEANIPPSQIWSTAGSDGNNWSGQNQDIRGSWLVLTNFNQQVDPAFVQSLCAQHGTVASFQHNYPMDGTALVKYNTPDEALKAKNALNMNMVGSTMLVATVATDHDVSNFMTARASGSWSSNLPSRFSASSTAYPNRDTATTLPSSGPAQQPFWGNNPSTSVTPGTTWAGNASYNLAWSRSTGDEPGRVTSPMHSLLPENLLGGETM